MDAHLFRRFCDALLPRLEGALIAKIQSPSPGHLSLTWFGHGREEQIYMRHERQKPFIFVTHPVGSGTKPDAWIMRLRKYAVGARIGAIVPQYLQRRLWFLLSGGDAKGRNGENVWLCLDMKEGASLHFMPADEPPAPDEMLWPQMRELAKALEDWRNWPVLTPDLRRALAGIMDERDQWALLGDLEAGGGDIFLYENDEGEICQAHAWPLSPQQRGSLKEISGPEILKLLERAGQDMVQAQIEAGKARILARPGQKRVKKLQKLLDKLRNEEKRLLQMAARKNDALALRDNLWQLSRDFRGSEIVLEYQGQERRIALDARFGPTENMERLFHLARRGERGLAMLAERKKTIGDELAMLTAASPAEIEVDGAAASGTAASPPMHNLKNTLPRNVQIFTSSDGYVLLRGRDARGNQAVRKLAKPWDIWLHVESGPGAHVIIRRKHPGDIVPDATLEEAGSLAASKSWLKDSADAAIVYAEARHISPMRNAPPGTMRIAKTLGARQVAVRPELEENLAG
ncbi:MAG: NFACT RNA binding domain-containing protein [Desulfovibrio sp.]|nr:NFACT RNA binding domain-containing protein [Desulfovibrio sp.]